MHILGKKVDFFNQKRIKIAFLDIEMMDVAKRGGRYLEKNDIFLENICKYHFFFVSLHAERFVATV